MIAMTTIQWARLSDRLFDVAAVTYVVAMVGYAYYLGFRNERVWLAARTITILGLGIHLVSIVARAMAADRVPWGNMWEYSSLLAFLVVLGYLVIVEGVYKVRTLGAFVLIFAAGTMGLARLWGLLRRAGAAGAGPQLVLAEDPRPRRNHRIVTVRPGRRRADDPLPVQVPLGAAGGGRDGRSPRPAGDGGVAGPGRPTALRLRRRRPRRRDLRAAAPRDPAPSAVLDRMAYRTIAFGFPIWTFAVIAGALWAQEAWGRYWGWDPKETWAFITWVIYAGYLHARATSGWKGTRAAAGGPRGIRLAPDHLLRGEPVPVSAARLREVNKGHPGTQLKGGTVRPVPCWSPHNRPSEA
jgi:ABC-type transport system involved in cytochrome c biogenesis permease subunit